MITDARIEPIHGRNLSDAWAQAFLKCHNATGSEISPSIVSFDVRDGEKWALENKEIRQAIDRQLKICSDKSNPCDVETVAGTIFPESIWKRCNGNRTTLFTEYEKMWPLVCKCVNNKRGTYFRRLMAFGDPKSKSKVCQLENIISFWNEGGRRRSALQASLFDPHQDFRDGPYLQFPCLQQLIFHPKGSNGSGGLEVMALYANQILLEKAYGNYLGLYRLGTFMAGEMGLNLTRVSCVASHLTLCKSGTTKKDLSPLVEILNRETVNEQ